MSRLAEETGISAGAVWTIIHEKLDMFEVSARWVPRMPSPFQKDTHCQCCQENLKLLTEDPEHSFQRLVTGDETWVIPEILSPKWSPCSGSKRIPPPLKSLALKNLLAKSWQLFSGMRKDFCF